jgi:hypothetical protein
MRIGRTERAEEEREARYFDKNVFRTWINNESAANVVTMAVDFCMGYECRRKNVVVE